MTKLGVQVQVPSDAVKRHLQHALYPTLMGIVPNCRPGFFAEIIAAYDEAGMPRPDLFPRVHNDGIADAYKQGASGATAIYDSIMPTMEEWHQVVGSDKTTSINERVIWTADDMKLLAECEAELCRRFEQHGFDLIVGNWSPAHPPLELWRFYGPALNAPNSFFGRHEYARPGMEWDEWWIFRYRKDVAAFRGLGFRVPPVYVTECGWDRCANAPGADHGGFRVYDQQAYLRWCQQYDTQAAPDLDVKCLLQFLAGSNQDWRTFDLVGSEIEEPMADYARNSPSPQYLRLLRTATGKIETIEREQYLRGVVPAEMPSHWPMETLKANAVAARTFLQRALERPLHDGAHLCDSSCCQNYRPDWIGPRTDQAVTETMGVVWSGSGQYVSQCGRVDIECPFCKGALGYNDKRYAGRLCQYGARELARAGANWRAILEFYYGGASADEDFTDAERAKILAEWYRVPASMKACAERGLTWLKELYQPGDAYAYVIAWNPKASGPVRLKMEPRTWQVVAEEKL